MSASLPPPQPGKPQEPWTAMIILGIMIIGAIVVGLMFVRDGWVAGTLTIAALLVIGGVAGKVYQHVFRSDR